MGKINGVTVTTVHPVMTPLEWVEDKADWPSLIQRQASFAKSALNTDLKIGIDIVANFEKHEAWQYVDQDRETFYRFRLNIDPASLPNILEGYKVLSAQGLTPTHWRQAVDAVKALGKQGGDHWKTKERDRKGRLKGPKSHTEATNRPKSKFGYWIARIKRDRPDIAERLANGGFRSVRAAAQAAGINVPRSTTLSQIRYYWRKASEAERENFLKEIGVDDSLAKKLKSHSIPPRTSRNKNAPA